MSMKLLARLSEQRSARIESSYLRNDDLIVLENVPAEMVFEASQGFMEHESQGHDYLPYFHLIGTIREIKGSFPFNVTSLYFSAKDESFLVKDLFYYPSPEELSHLIETGRFYSRNFEIPTILSANTYVLPCRVNLSIVPPANQAQYEANQYTHFMELDDEDKTNLPVFYIGITGSGVTRRNDRLLDYYGIDVPEMDDQFVFTAESSGYTDPPLMKYMEAPMVAPEAQVQDQQYLENDKEGLLQTDAERRREELEQMAEKQEQPEFHAATPEDALIAQTDRAIEQRMSERFDGQRMSLAAAREHDKRVQADEDQARPVKPEADPGRYDGPREAGVGPARDGQSQTKPAGQAQPKPEEKTADKTADKQADKPVDKQAGTQPEAAQEAAPTKQDEREALRAKVEQLRGRSRLSPTGPAQAKPGDKAVSQNQQMKDVEMDFDPEHNVHVEADRAEGGAAQPDKSSLAAKKGGDVSDAKLQVKVDEAHAAEMARAAAARAAAGGREVTEPLEKAAQADAAAEAKKRAAAEGKAAPEEDEDEYL